MVDVGGHSIDINSFYFLGHVNEAKKNGYTQFAAGRGDWFTHADGHTARIDPILAFFNDKEIETVEHWYVKLQTREERPQEFSRFYRDQTLFERVMCEHKVILGSRVNIEEFLQQYAQIHLAFTGLLF